MRSVVRVYPGPLNLRDFEGRPHIRVTNRPVGGPQVRTSAILCWPADNAGAPSGRSSSRPAFPSATGATVIRPRVPDEVHGPLPPGVDVEALFTDTETRRVARDFTTRFPNQYWKVRRRRLRSTSLVTKSSSTPARWRPPLPCQRPIPSGRTLSRHPNTCASPKPSPQQRRSRARNRQSPDRPTPGANNSTPVPG